MNAIDKYFDFIVNIIVETVHRYIYSSANEENSNMYNEEHFFEKFLPKQYL